MPNVDFAILPLLATTLVFAIIELGLSAYSVSIFSENQLGSAPGPVNFLVFASLWTMLITPIFIALPMLGDRNNRFWLNSFGRPAAWVAPVTLAINAVTMIFWLAGFAALANLFGGYNPQGVPGALLAFAIMLVSQNGRSFNV
jgi:Membrane-associating domain